MAEVSLPQADLISKTMAQGTKVYMTCAEKLQALKLCTRVSKYEEGILGIPYLWNPYRYKIFFFEKIYVSKLKFDHFLRLVARQFLNIE